MCLRSNVGLLLSEIKHLDTIEKSIASRLSP